MGLGITEKNNETKDIIKVIKSLGNSAILLKQNLGKSNSQAEGIFNFLAPKMRAVLPLMKILFTLHYTTLIISKKEMKYLMKIFYSVKESALLIKGVGETIQNEATQQKAGVLGMLLGTLFASKLIGKYVSRQRIFRPGKGVFTC